MTDSDVLEIIVHGPRCPQWEQPQTVDDWQALEVAPQETESGSEGVCPACGEVVWFMLDGGIIDFGA